MERTTADRVKDPIIGRLLDGRYRVGNRVARGGMATVYEATDTRLDRTVAVKVMHEGLGDDEAFSRRFRREAQAAARLAHQNVVAVFDQGDDAGTLFLVMEYVPGITLRDLIREESPIPPVKALTVIEPVLAALAAAHRQGMIHRDVKPENVLLSDHGLVKVADFGLARAINADTQHTNTGVLIGTVSYLSPELVVDGEADARADVYAVGVMIYEMLTGQKPHQAESPIQVAYKHVHEDIPAPSARVPSLPAYVDALVARATVRDTTYRPADAGVLLHQVRRVRSALEAGVTSDPELVADLLPHHPSRRDPFEDTDGQMPRTILDPSQDTGAWSPVDDAGFDRDPAAAPSSSAAEAFTPYSSTSGTVHSPDDVYDQENEHTSNLAVLAPAVPTSDGYNGYNGPDGPDGPDGRDGYDGYDGGDPPSRPRQRPVRPSAPRRSRRGPIILALLLATALVVGIGGWYFGVARYTTTPGVINLTQVDAKTKLSKVGLTMKVADQGYSETVPAGAVLSTDPMAGSRILKSGTVDAVLSRGPERHAVPGLDKMTLDQAQGTIKDAGLSFGRAVEEYSGKVAKGKVISSAPVAGTELRRDAAVDVVISKGPKPIPVPNFTGRPAAEAEAALGKLGLKTSSTTSYDNSVPKGSVISQTPQSGTLHKGDSVALKVSLGPRLVAIPKGLVGMGLDAATALLQSKGFVAQAAQSPTYIGLQYVLSTDPAEGTKIPRGSTVILYLV